MNSSEQPAVSTAKGTGTRSILEALNRQQKELLLAELVRDLYGDLDGVETIVDARFEAVGYFMSLAARERYVAVALGYPSVDEMPPEDRGPYYSPAQVLAHLESVDQSESEASS
jgi:hypothetical protein